MKKHIISIFTIYIILGFALTFVNTATANWMNIYSTSGKILRSINQNVYVMDFNKNGFIADAWGLSFFSLNGELIWSFQYPWVCNFRTSIIDDENRVYSLCSDENYDIYVSALDEYGQELWQEKSIFPCLVSLHLHFDLKGNLIFFTKPCEFWKYSNSGELIMHHDCDMQKECDYPSGNDSMVDAEGFIYSVATDRDSYLYKFSPKGKELWHTKIDEISNLYQGVQLSTDGKGGPYVLYTIGYYHENIGVLKFSSDGELEWDLFMDDLYMPATLAVDQSGKVIVSGTIRFSHDSFGRGIITRKIDALGEFIWEQEIIKNFPGMETTYVISDNKNNTYVMANQCQQRYDEISDCSDDLYMLYKYDANGSPVWFAEQEDELDDYVSDDSPIGDDIVDNEEGYIYAAFPHKIALSPNLAVDFSNPLDDDDDDDSSGCGCGC